MAFDFTGRVAIVTGGASGIGRATARAMAERGAAVVLADVDDDRLLEACNEIRSLGADAELFHCDVSRDDDVEALVAGTLQRFGRLDVMMNNAGMVVGGPPEQIPLDDWRRIVDVNLLGMIRGTNAALAHMLERRSGYLLYTSSLAGLLAYDPMRAPYIATKFAVMGYAETMALYCKPRGVDVSVVCPVAVRTNFGQQLRLIGGPPAVRTASLPAAYERMSPAGMANRILDAMDERRFLVLSHDRIQADVASRRADLDGAIAKQVARVEERQQAQSTAEVP